MISRSEDISFALPFCSLPGFVQSKVLTGAAKDPFGKARAQTRGNHSFAVHAVSLLWCAVLRLLGARQAAAHALRIPAQAPAFVRPPDPKAKWQ